LIELLNHISEIWIQYFTIMNIQNAVFISAILVLLYLFRNQSARFLRVLTLLGLAKLVVPPVLFPGSSESIGMLYNRVSTVVPGVVTGETLSSVHLTVSSFIFLFWITGMVVVLVVITSKYFQATNIQLIEHPNQQFGSVPIYTSNDVSSPLLVGIFRPKIVVPQDWEHFTHEEQNSVLAHEIAHIEQRDHYVTLLQIIVVTLHFYNPLVWILSRQLNYYSEMACDDYAIEANSGRQNKYLENLINLAERKIKSGRTILPIWSFTESFSQMKARIQYQTQSTLTSRRKLNGRQWALIILLGFTLIPLSCDFTADDQSGQQTNPALTEQTEVKKHAEFDVPPQPVGGMQDLQKNIHYPEAAIAAGTEGTVIVKATFDKSGNISGTEILKSVDKNGLNEAALQAVTDTDWKPAEKDGKPVNGTITIPISFKLSNK